MDIRTEIINQVLDALVDVDCTIRDRVEHVLHIKLQDYKVEKNCTEVVLHDGTAIGLLKKFLATKRLEGKAEKTLKKYQSELEKFIYTLRKPIYEVETYDLRLYLALYKDERKVSNRTLDNTRKTLSSFFSWLAAEGFLGRNPAAALQQIKYEKVVRKAFTSVEREKIKNACENLRDRALTEFLYTSGLRVSEVVSLDREDIDFAKRQAVVLGKGGKERIFYLSEIAAEYLQEYLRSRSDDNSALFVWNKAPYNRLSKNGIEAVVKHIGNVAGVEKTHPHRFRRTLATDLVRKNVPIQDVAEILGHADLRTTQVYVCIYQESVQYHYNKAIA